MLPGKENAKLKTGEDIRKLYLLYSLLLSLTLSSDADINWTGRGGNVSASSYLA